ncbi:MAG: radical SAM protein [bacterium]
MRLALVFNPFSYKIHEENLYIVQRYFGMFPPLSLAWVAAIAEKAGHEVIIVDARTLRLTKDQTLQKLQEFKPDVLGFMMTTYMFPETLEWTAYLKKRLKPNPYVLIGGYNLRVYPKESLMHTEIDFGCVEHALYTVPALLQELRIGTKNFDAVPGLIFKKDGEIIITPHTQKIDFNLFPNPARHLLPNDLYAEFVTQRKNFTVMVTSLGCPRNCLFCEAGGTPYVPRSPETVANEIEECFEKYNIREIDIFDYDFTAVRSRVLKICSLIRQRNIDITWACRSRIDTVDTELLHAMRSAGCERIYFGIEAGSNDMLDKVNKGITLEKIKENIALCRKSGIKTLGFFLIGAPGETKETVKKTVDFAVKLKLDYVQFSKCLAKPLTPLWKEMVEKQGKDYWKEWILGAETDHALPRPWTNLTNDEIDTLAKNAYVRFHSRPVFLIKSTLDCRSFSEFFRKLCAYIQMILSQSRISKKIKNYTAYPENILRVMLKRHKFFAKKSDST